MNFSDTYGSVTIRILKFYEKLAKGGVGVIITEGIHVDSLAVKGLHRILIDNDNYIEGLR
jgi:2,4-dienoyl-CoA reductase-like NADH-dependent reductase (Old Yellow Enzyme family)